MRKKFYILYQFDPNDSWEPSVPIMYFKDKEVADKILSDREKMADDEAYYLEEATFNDDTKDFKKEVVKYYVCTIYKDEDELAEKLEELEELEESYLYYRGDNFKISYETCLESYSVKSIEDARENAYKAWKETYGISTDIIQLEKNHKEA